MHKRLLRVEAADEIAVSMRVIFGIGLAGEILFVDVSLKENSDNIHDPASQEEYSSLAYHKEDSQKVNQQCYLAMINLAM